ncbi:response regulator [Teichococcus vastitatis]|jgi:DNA-binding NtrC family response regulator|uniref:Response regulator n=1 Tax=Teichococcus vastitatis TaxID=2307076 RepID=A0ABS9W911_9PROT|nr:response regulator [Pseudoroseomonas vastitatis]MCI0755698.1 response regulator [Pseudoroseomonas vastitatis]
MNSLTPEQSCALLKDRRVLVVEDDILFAMCLEDELTDVGAEIVGCATSVGDALRIIDHAAARGRINAVLLDLNLRGCSSLPVADALARRGIPFVFSTGYGEGCNTGRHPTVPVLHKPYNMQKLIYTVEALCQEWESRQDS